MKQSIGFLFFYFIGLITSEIIQDHYFEDMVLPRLQNIKISGRTYTQLIQNGNDAVSFETSKSYTRPVNNIRDYPLFFDFPSVAILKDEDYPYLKNLSNPNIHGADKVIAQIENIINKVRIDQDDPVFVIKFGFSLRKNHRTPNDVQIIVVTDNKKTYIMLNTERMFSSYDNIFKITGGRGIFNYSLSKDNSTDNTLIYEISTSRMIKMGCYNLIVEESNENRTVLPLAMSKYLLSSLGGELITVRGPCIDNKTIGSTLKLNIRNPFNQTVESLNMTFNSTFHTFSLITPFLWYSGMYEFKISFKNVDFISQVEIYSWDSSNAKYLLTWAESREMNSPRYSHIHATLESQAEISENSLIHLNIFDLLKSEQLNKIQLKAIPFKYSGIENKQLKIALTDLCDSKEYIDIYTNIGFFSMTDNSKSVSWTKPFSLMWLKRCPPNIYNETHCRSYISQETSQVHDCPDYLDKISFLKSTFKELKLVSYFLPIWAENFNCFAEILPKLQNDKKGVTCCYFKNTKYLAYGQDFYHQDWLYFGSYIWSISPFINPIKHFLKDIIPIMSCCPIHDTPKLCADFWYQTQKIQIGNIQRDYRSDIFGDPHVIPFKLTSNYSFLGNGQYQLITTKENIFTLQGRFYHGWKQLTFLKAVAFNVSSIKMVITTTSNNITDLQWKVLIGTQNNILYSLPYLSENVLIFLDENPEKLDIYIRLEDNSTAFLKLERLYYMKNSLEYINMQVYLSNDIEKYKVRGLFGQLGNLTNNTALYKRDSEEPVSHDDLNTLQRMFDFGVSWKIVSNSENLFFDLNFVTKDDIFQNPIIEPNSFCEDYLGCLIDSGELDVNSITLNAYKNRYNFDLDWKNVALEGNVCDHPSWKYIKLDSLNFTKDSIVKIMGCLDSTLVVDPKNIALTCTIDSEGKREWTPNVGPICKEKTVPPLPVTDSTIQQNDNVIIISSSIGLGLLILISISIIICFILIRKKQKVTIVTKNELEMSTAGLAQSESIYENSINVCNDLEEYATYSEINKN